MADKQVDIEVVTNADLSSVEDLQTVLEETEASAETLGDTISQVDGSSMEDAAADADELAGLSIIYCLSDTSPETAESCHRSLSHRRYPSRPGASFP